MFGAVSVMLPVSVIPSCRDFGSTDDSRYNYVLRQVSSMHLFMPPWSQVTIKNVFLEDLATSKAPATFPTAASAFSTASM